MNAEPKSKPPRWLEAMAMLALLALAAVFLGVVVFVVFVLLPWASV